MKNSAKSTLKTLKVSEEQALKILESALIILDSNEIIPVKVGLVVKENEYVDFDIHLGIEPKQCRVLKDQYEDYIWETGLYQVIGDHVSAHFIATNHRVVIEEILDKIDQDLKNNPACIVPLNQTLMDEIFELVKDVEI